MQSTQSAAFTRCLISRQPPTWTVARLDVPALWRHHCHQVGACSSGLAESLQVGVATSSCRAGGFKLCRCATRRWIAAGDRDESGAIVRWLVGRSRRKGISCHAVLSQRSLRSSTVSNIGCQACKRRVVKGHRRRQLQAKLDADRIAQLDCAERIQPRLQVPSRGKC